MPPKKQPQSALEFIKAQVGKMSTADIALHKAVMEDLEEELSAQEHGFVMMNQLSRQAFPGSLQRKCRRWLTHLVLHAGIVSMEDLGHVPCRYGELPLEICQILLSTLCRKSAMWVCRWIYHEIQWKWLLIEMRVPPHLLIEKCPVARFRNLQTTALALSKCGKSPQWVLAVTRCPTPDEIDLANSAKNGATNVANAQVAQAQSMQSCMGTTPAMTQGMGMTPGIGMTPAVGMTPLGSQNMGMQQSQQMVFQMTPGPNGQMLMQPVVTSASQPTTNSQTMSQGVNPTAFKAADDKVASAIKEQKASVGKAKTRLEEMQASVAPVPLKLDFLDNEGKQARISIHEGADPMAKTPQEKMQDALEAILGPKDQKAIDDFMASPRQQKQAIQKTKENKRIMAEIAKLSKEQSKEDALDIKNAEKALKGKMKTAMKRESRASHSQVPSSSSKAMKKMMKKALP